MGAAMQTMLARAYRKANLLCIVRFYWMANLLCIVRFYRTANLLCIVFSRMANLLCIVRYYRMRSPTWIRKLEGSSIRQVKHAVQQRRRKEGSA